MNENFSYCHVAGISDVGLARKANEDSWATFQSPNGLITVVCDGMGGHVGGAIASSTAVEAIKYCLMSEYIENPRVAIGDAISAANRAIINRATAQPELQGMGSTCVLLLIRNGLVYWGHVGDSRIYLIRSQTIKRLTKDHSYVQALLDVGEITPDEAKQHPRKNEITNALGFTDMGKPTITRNPIKPEAGDCFLLCSDGLTGMVSDAEIKEVVSQQQTLKAQSRAEQLVNIANRNGGKDNITVAIVEFSLTPKSYVIPIQNKQDAHKANKRKKELGYKTLLIICLVLLAIVLFLMLYKWEPTKIESIPPTTADSTIITKKDSTETITLPDVTFKKGEIIAKLVFNKDNLVITSTTNGKETIRTINGCFQNRIQNNIIEDHNIINIEKENNIIIFRFGDVFNENSLTLNLSVGKKIFTVIVPVSSEDSENQSTESSATTKENNTKNPSSKVEGTPILNNKNKSNENHNNQTQESKNPGSTIKGK